jgi:hypothetical protein
MNRLIMCTFIAAATAGVALTAAGVSGSGPGTSQAAPAIHQLAGAGVSAVAATPGAQAWIARYNNGGNDRATSVAVSPDGTMMVVTGSSRSRTSGADYATVAYSTATGATLWAKRYNGPGNGRDAATSVSVSPSGRVFVTGSSYGGASRAADYATIAYQGTSGAQAWVARYNGPASRTDSATSLAVSPDGTRVVVTGSSAGKASGNDYATIAYSTVAGIQLWAKRYNGPAGSDGPAADKASAVIVSRNAAVAVITGGSAGDYATVAYRIAAAPVVFRGLGTWVDAYDYSALDPGTAISDMKAHGVNTLYLATARYDSPSDILYPEDVAAWLAAAHAAGIKVVGWYVPDYANLNRDVRRTLAIASYVSPDGQRFDGIGIDIEYPLDVASPAAWNQAVATQLARVRAGTTLPILTIVLPPVLIQNWPDPNRFATFPWSGIGADANAVAPMSYWTSYTPSRRCTAGDQQYCAYQYTRDNVLLSNNLTGLQVHVIGGAGQAAALSEVSDYVRAARETAAAGGGFYDYPTTRAAFWPYLGQLSLSNLPAP